MFGLYNYLQGISINFRSNTGSRKISKANNEYIVRPSRVIISKVRFLLRNTIHAARIILYIYILKKKKKVSFHVQKTSKFTLMIANHKYMEQNDKMNG